MKSLILVDDDKSLCDALAAGLKSREYAVTSFVQPELALDALRTCDPDVVVCDLNMPGMNGIELCSRVVGARPDVPVIVLTAFGSYETAVAAIRAGAYDFLSKPVKLDAMVIALDRAVAHRRLHDEVHRLRLEVARGGSAAELVGQSRAMHRVRELVVRVGPSDASVLITGESGTGKELVARALHAVSGRRDRPFVALNCAALPEALLESELFGHVRGAFTDAREARPGLLRQAEGGTVFLDEIGDMPLGLQPKLLRVLQERTVRPVGGTSEVPIDVRFVAATNRDIEEAIDQRRFREDLYFRINVVRIDLPPLRARGSGDVLALAQTFIEQIGARQKKDVRGLSPAAAERLVRYSWPGNVRELMNCVEHAVTLAAFDKIGPDDLPPRVADASSPAAPETWWPSEILPIEEMERRYVLHALDALQGNKSAAARALGIERKTLYRKLEHWGLPTDSRGDGKADSTGPEPKDR